ncbi:putative hotdog family 3-hydroxylacyl-ACP dehydratase [Hydromonas duriensis]|uniref:Putative hotdog family 3-hydroxylacyl-ACP dehydratase n=2 Tax=Hydromonas duriensis TaxID=1527608 RepID=A0A4V3DJQ8_9BURK|nr:putative hotdog family 3-hydroxylacyl-ACP dehydratase [Hydromonas duriensis]
MTNSPTLPCPAHPYIPHESPMALVDAIVSCDDNKITTEIYLDESHLFAQNQKIPTYVGIEFMAQSAAAWSGFNARANLINNEYHAPIGYLLGTREFMCFTPYFKVGDTLTVSCECLLQSSEGLGSFDCQVVNQDGQLLAQARLSVYQPNATNTNT